MCQFAREMRRGTTWPSPFLTTFSKAVSRKRCRAPPPQFPCFRPTPFHLPESREAALLQGWSSSNFSRRRPWREVEVGIPPLAQDALVKPYETERSTTFWCACGTVWMALARFKG